jgi:hypothetical protein
MAVATWCHFPTRRLSRKVIPLRLALPALMIAHLALSSVLVACAGLPVGISSPSDASLSSDHHLLLLFTGNGAGQVDPVPGCT